MRVKHSWRGIELQSSFSSETISERQAQQLICDLEEAIELAQQDNDKEAK